MVVAHRLTPVGHCETRVDALSFFECEACFIELETVQRFDAGQERFLCCRRAGIRKIDVAELGIVGQHGQWPKYQQESQFLRNGHLRTPEYSYWQVPES